MTQRTEIRMNLDALDEIREQVGNKYRARVGVLGAKAERDATPGEYGDLNNAELLLIQMFGSVINNIPPRDPLETPIIKHRRELIQKIASGKMRQAFEAGDYKKMFALLGAAGEAIVLEAFATSGDGDWAPNAPSTIAQKGSDRPLIDTAELRKSISSDVVKAGGESKGSLSTAGGV